MPRKRKPIAEIAQRFGRLTFLYEEEPVKGEARSGQFLCDCGSLVKINLYSATKGLTQSCGCYKSEATASRLTKHGCCQSSGKSPEYKVWSGIKRRCHNKNEPKYHDYGGRGIFVCDEWMNDFPQFLKDMGRRPTRKHQIERIDNNKGYSAKNCR